MERTLRFRSYDGTPLEGTYASSESPGNPVAILVHGIASSRDELGLFSGLANHLADENVPSFRFDYRCHGESNQPMESMTLSGIVHDIESAATLGLSEAGAQCAHIVGMSFGGGLSAFWAATTMMSVTSVVMLAPVIDYEEDILGQYGAIVNGKITEDTSMILQRQGYLEMGGIRYGSALLNELRFISGVEGLRLLKCESLIIHGDADSIVPYSCSERFAKMHKHCELVNMSGTDHGFGVGDDEDLSSPETKGKHKQVFGIISRFLRRNSCR